MVNPNWLTDPRDQEVAVSGFKRARAVFQSAAVQPVLIGSEAFPGENVTTDQDILDVIKSSSDTIHHAAGTNRMGMINDSMAVVDSQGILAFCLRLGMQCAPSTGLILYFLFSPSHWCTRCEGGGRQCISPTSPGTSPSKCLYGTPPLNDFEPYALLTCLDALAEKIADDILGTSTVNSSLSANYTATSHKFLAKS